MRCGGAGTAIPSRCSGHCRGSGWTTCSPTSSSFPPSSCRGPAADLYVDVLVPVDGRHQRLLDLDEFADAIEAGSLDVGAAIDGLRRWQRFLDRHLHADRDPAERWTDFPPQRPRELAALPAPLGPVVTAPE